MITYFYTVDAVLENNKYIVKRTLEASITLKDKRLQLIEGDIDVVKLFLSSPVYDNKTGTLLTFKDGDMYLKALPYNFGNSRWDIITDTEESK